MLKEKNCVSNGSMFDIYVKFCDYEMTFDSPYEIKIVSSDDVFDYLINNR